MMNEGATQPIDRRIMEAAKRAKEREDAQKKAEEELAQNPVVDEVEDRREAKAGINIPLGPAAGSTASIAGVRAYSVEAQQAAQQMQGEQPASNSVKETLANPAAYRPGAAKNAADLQARRDALPEDRVFLREVGAGKAAASEPAQAQSSETEAVASDKVVQPPAAVSMDAVAEDDGAQVEAAPAASPAAAGKVGADPAETALFLDAFFGELEHCGVKDVVVSPGSRSTALAMKAYERFGDVYMDVDERGAAFFALGLAKAKGSPVAVICTSGSAVGNWMPAVLEAESSRVPLLLLSGDRPPRLQHVGAPQTCDQLNIFGNHVKRFVQMPLPSGDPSVLSYARQMALEACIAAHGAQPGAASCDGGPVHLNFPFEEPLKPLKRQTEDPKMPLPPTVVPGQGFLPRDAAGLFRIIKGKRTIALCGEGSCNSDNDVQVLLEFARKRNVPLLADPLSGLRSFDDPLIIDNYDSVFGENEPPSAEVVIRFGRWPISKRCCQAVQNMGAMQIAVDMRDTRDISSSTDLFVRCMPVAFAQALNDVPTVGAASAACAQEWTARNEAAALRIASVRLADDADSFEGAYVNELMDMIPAESLLFCANSMSVRAVDTFYCRASKRVKVLCNRGLNGIDGTLSSAFGAAQAFSQTTLLTGDLALLHDANALALQGEMHIRELHGSAAAPTIVIVMLNNNGGGIFDMLPQKSDEDYFERLFLTPQSVNFKHLASAFGISYRNVSTVHDFRRTYVSAIREPGISLIDVSVPLEGLARRYKPYW